MTQRQPKTTSEFRCRGKQQYASERIAAIRAAQITEKRGVQLSTYRWHLTSQLQKGARKKPLVLARA